MRRAAARLLAAPRLAAMQAAASSSTRDAPVPLLAAAAVAAAAFAWQTTPPSAEAAGPPSRPRRSLLTIPWVASLAAETGVSEVLTAKTLSSRAHRVLGGDHLFSALTDAHLVSDVVAFYDSTHRRLHFVVALGPDVCGWPGVVHGGLTAALVDEAMGHLFLALRSAGALPFSGPAFTASLTVDYRKRVPSPSTAVLVTAEVDSAVGRKLTMRATVSDGPHTDATTYAEASALFVSPKATTLVRDAGRWVWSGSGWFGGGSKGGGGG